MPYVGDTVKLKATFKSWPSDEHPDGQLANPDDVTLAIYDNQMNVIEEDLVPTNASTGVYEYEYVVPAGYGPLVYEFTGTLETKPILARSKFDREWVKV